jgi:fluoride exporter
MRIALSVALGGALGAVGRYYIASLIVKWTGTGFPWGTLGVNVAGSFLLGLLVEYMALSWSASPEMRALLTVGMLGAFTTFSTVSLELVLMTERGQFGLAAIYAAVSFAAGVTGLFAGLRMVRMVLV